MERLFLITKYDKEGKQYITRVIKSNMYPSGKTKSGEHITEIPNGGECCIYINDNRLN